MCTTIFNQNNAAHPEIANVSLKLMEALAFRGTTDRLMAIAVQLALKLAPGFYIDPSIPHGVTLLVVTRTTESY